MRLPRVGTTAVVSAVLGAAVLAGPLPAQAGQGTLTVTALTGAKYVGGQAITFSGNIGAPGQRTVHLQFDMSSGKNPWVDVPDFSAQTNGNGDFRFQFTAPAMRNIRMRVVAAGGLATAYQVFQAKSQELTLTVPPQVRAGVPFTIGVDTTPTVKGHPGDTPPPAFPGRTLTLQQRVGGDHWQDVPGGTAVTGPTGQAVIPVAGVQASTTYRVVEEDYAAPGYAVAGKPIGWFPSFPYTVRVAGTDGTATATSAGGTSTRDASTAGSAGTPLARATASTAYGWGRSLWDFAWEYGESLTSPPARGTRIAGSWLDTSSGSGRVMPRNGQLSLDSGPGWTGPGDVGTTRATLTGQGMRYGRWETKVRLQRVETGAGNYHAVLELVPDRTADYHCGAQNITVADIPAYGSSFRFGVTSRGGHQWTGTKKVAFGGTAADLAVEVAKGHITWFLDGRPIGSVKSSAAVSDVPLTPRLSLVGQGTSEMNHTMVYSDWQRAWSLKGGRQVTTRTGLRARTYHASC